MDLLSFDYFLLMVQPISLPVLLDPLLIVYSKKTSIIFLSGLAGYSLFSFFFFLIAFNVKQSYLVFLFACLFSSKQLS